MKKLIFVLLAFIGLGAKAQIYDTLPAGSKPYGNQLYISTTGLIIGGTGSAKFRVLGTKKYVDSLLALKVDVVAGKGLSTNDYTTAEKTKLSGIATGATANQTDAYLLARANHTGVQAQSTVTNLVTDLAGKEPVFSKNTAFNKNFGSGAGTVAEGNDSRILNGQIAWGWGNHASAGYLTQTTGDARYLRLIGGTLSGDLQGTTSRFSTYVGVGASGGTHIDVTSGDIKYYASNGSTLLSLYPLALTANRVQRYQDDDGTIALTKNFGAGQTIGAYSAGLSDGVAASYIFGGTPITGFDFVFARNAASEIKPLSKANLKAGLATTLQDVTSVGNSTTTIINAPNYTFSSASASAPGIVTSGSSFGLLSGNIGYGLSANNAGGLDIMANQNGVPIRFFNGTDNTSPTERMRIFGTGNVVIGSTTDNGAYKLQVTGGISATGDVGIVGNVSAANLSASNYTATAIAATNITTIGNGTNFYSRVGNIVTVSGSVTATNSATGASSFSVAIPVPSNFTNSTDATGTSWVENSGGGFVFANVGSQYVSIYIGNHTNNASKQYRFTFQYIIK